MNNYSELSQLAPVLIIEFGFFALCMLMFVFRKRIRAAIRDRKALRVAVRVISAVLLPCIFAFAYIGLYKASVYTHIDLDLTRVWSVSVELVVLLASTIALLLCAPVLIGAVFPSLKLFSVPGRAVSAILLSVFLTVSIFNINFTKEENFVSSWAESLAVERDKALEEQLLRAEPMIASDDIVAIASESSDLVAYAQKRITQLYLHHILQGYDVSVKIGGNFSDTGIEAESQIDQNSRFFYAPLDENPCRYVGMFLYYSSRGAVNPVYVTVVRENGSRPFSYRRGVTEGNPGLFRYSYAKFKGGERQYYKGSYAYPTRLEPQRLEWMRQQCHFEEDGSLHFVSAVSDDEIIVVSRRRSRGFLNVVFLLFFALIFFFVLTPFGIHPGKSPIAFEKHTFKRTINLILTGSLFLTMTALALASVTFVYDRSQTNFNRMINDKCSSIRNMLQDGFHSMLSSEISSRETLEILRKAGENTRSEITLYLPDGRYVMSTTPEASEQDMENINAEAFDQLMKQHKGSFIREDKDGPRSIYTMYAPITAAGGKVIALFSSPYLEIGNSFRRDAIAHSFSILVVFIFLLLLSYFLVSFFVDKTFRPLSEMSSKMSRGGIDSLEHIEYSREDEISSLIKSYNQMADDLAASTRALAQAERDKAWNEMARQVAHEIKNPLTPMKLQLQRVMRLKAQGAPGWEDKFDEMSKVLLEHIDILSETANEFSVFAKLGSEQNTKIDFSEFVRNELAMYLSDEKVEFDFKGCKDAIVSAPKPQLSRVVVNLVNNAVQACEGEAEPAVRLRVSVNGAVCVLTVEDNGPGVSEENVEKIFTPNFTTKTSGHGLGLAICRSVLERCGGSIEYSRSASLGGACFTVKYPLA